MFMNGGGLFRLKGLTTLGEIETKMPTGFEAIQLGDDSRRFLLFGIATIVLCFLFILLWGESIKSGYIAECAANKGVKPNGFIDDVKEYFNSKLHKTMLFLPIAGITVMTIIPIIFMICMQTIIKAFSV